MMGGGATTRILTTHQLNFVERADRIAIMDRGRIVAVGTLRYVTFTYNLIGFYSDFDSYGCK